MPTIQEMSDAYDLGRSGTACNPWVGTAQQLLKQWSASCGWNNTENCTAYIDATQLSKCWMRGREQWELDQKVARELRLLNKICTKEAKRQTRIRKKKGVP